MEYCIYGFDIIFSDAILYDFVADVVCDVVLCLRLSLF